VPLWIGREQLLHTFGRGAPCLSLKEGMLVQVKTDNNITGREQLVEEVEGVVHHSLGRFSGPITRVEVHRNDENSHKQGPDDKRCVTEKLKSVLDKEIGRLRSH